MAGRHVIIGGMPAVSVTIGIPVSDLEAASRWYGQVLGKPYDIEPVAGIREFEVAGTWIQLDQGPAAGGSWTLRIGVADLNAERQRLEESGVELSGTRTVPGVISFFDFHDPDGNQLSCYQEQESPAQPG
jgi:predicted enzyme related to lactoylglutathione lyase